MPGVLSSNTRRGLSDDLGNTVNPVWMAFSVNLLTIPKKGVILTVDLRKVYRGRNRRLPTGIEGCRDSPSFSLFLGNRE